MIKIYYPTYPFKLRDPEKNKEEIWDELRKQWVRLTPEEWKVVDAIKQQRDKARGPRGKGE